MTSEAARARRQQVAELELRGVSASGIAKAVGSDYRTIVRDLRALAAERARSTSMAAERHRLLQAAKMVEQQAWTLFGQLAPGDGNGRLGCLNKVLLAQAQGARMVEAVAMADLEERVAELERAVKGVAR